MNCSFWFHGDKATCCFQYHDVTMAYPQNGLLLYIQLTDVFCKAFSAVTLQVCFAVILPWCMIFISFSSLELSCSPLAKELQTLLKGILRFHMRLPFTWIVHPWKNCVPWHQSFSFNGTRSIALQHRFSNTAAVTLFHILEWSFYWKIMPNERIREEAWKRLCRSLEHFGLCGNVISTIYLI